VTKVDRIINDLYLEGKVNLGEAVAIRMSLEHVSKMKRLPKWLTKSREYFTGLLTNE